MPAISASAVISNFIPTERPDGCAFIAFWSNARARHGAGNELLNDLSESWNNSSATVVKKRWDLACYPKTASGFLNNHQLLKGKGHRSNKIRFENNRLPVKMYSVTPTLFCCLYHMFNYNSPSLWMTYSTVFTAKWSRYVNWDQNKTMFFINSN